MPNKKDKKDKGIGEKVLGAGLALNIAGSIPQLSNEMKIKRGLSDAEKQQFHAFKEHLENKHLDVVDKYPIEVYPNTDMKASFSPYNGFGELGKLTEDQINDLTSDIKPSTSTDPNIRKAFDNINEGLKQLTILKNSPSINTGINPATLAHEMGHALNFEATPERLRDLKMTITSSRGQQRLSMAGAPLLFTPLRKGIKGDDEDSISYKVIDKIEDHPGLIPAAASVPTLLEEGAASARGLKMLYDFDRLSGKGIGETLKNVGRHSADLGSAFATYLGAAGMLAGGTEAVADILKHRKEKLKQKQEAKKMKQNKHASAKALLAEFEKIASEVTPQVLEEIAKEALSQNPSYVSDFLSGFDPTGVATFRNSMNTDSNHGAHKAMADVGGFVGGAVAGGLIPAAGAGAAALLLKGKNPHLADDLKQMALGSIDSFHPGKLKRYLQSFGDMSKFKTQGTELLRANKELMAQNPENIADPAIVEVLQKMKAANVDPENVDMSKLMGVMQGVDQQALGQAANKTMQNSDQIAAMRQKIVDLKHKSQDLESLSNRMSERYYGGRPVEEGAGRAFTAVTTLGTSALGGAMNAGSAHLQYDTAQNMKKQQQNNENQ